MSSEKSEWFTTWFNSPFYHQLYKNRDDKEAHEFLDVLIKCLGLEPGARVLDLACGRGRYAKYLSAKGFDVIGIDLSVNSIEYARKFEHIGLNFHVHDMRKPLNGEKFDYVFNLFTSFGYFSSDEEDKAVLESALSVMKSDGLLVIDYMNCEKAIRDLKSEESLIVDDVRFDLERWVEHGKIHKKICVEEQQFKEEVKVLYLDQFHDYAKATGFTLDEVYGSYQLQPFQNKDSDRMIMVFRPK